MSQQAKIIVKYFLTAEDKWSNMNFQEVHPLVLPLVLELRHGERTALQQQERKRQEVGGNVVRRAFYERGMCRLRICARFCKLGDGQEIGRRVVYRALYKCGRRRKRELESSRARASSIGFSFKRHTVCVVLLFRAWDCFWSQGKHLWSQRGHPCRRYSHL